MRRALLSAVAMAVAAATLVGLAGPGPKYRRVPSRMAVVMYGGAPVPDCVKEDIVTTDQKCSDKTTYVDDEPAQGWTTAYSCQTATERNKVCAAAAENTGLTCKYTSPKCSGKLWTSVYNPATQEWSQWQVIPTKDCDITYSDAATQQKDCAPVK
jgi:hypothetical protein